LNKYVDKGQLSLKIKTFDILDHLYSALTFPESAAKADLVCSLNFCIAFAYSSSIANRLLTKEIRLVAYFDHDLQLNDKRVAGRGRSRERTNSLFKSNRHPVHVLQK